MTLKVEYRGYEIKFSENADQWECWAVKAESKSLQSVKAKIDNMHRKLRKENSVQAIVLVEYAGIRTEEAKIIEYLKPERATTRSFQRVGDGEIIDHEVAFMSPAGRAARDKDRLSRKTAKLSSLYQPTQENFAIIEKMYDLYQQQRELASKQAELKKTLKQITVEEIAKLMKASDHQFSEGE